MWLLLDIGWFVLFFWIHLTKTNWLECIMAKNGLQTLRIVTIKHSVEIKNMNSIYQKLELLIYKINLVVFASFLRSCIKRITVLNILPYHVLTGVQDAWKNGTNAYKELIEKCNCPRPCEYTNYDVAVSCGSFPSIFLESFYADALNISQDKIRYVVSLI